MSAAYKYAAMQAFSIPTEGDNDTENYTHEVAPKNNISNLMTDHLAAIDATSNSEELTAAYQAAFEACNGDQAWQAKVMAAKKSRVERAKKEKANG
jgi:hypothetical protein